MSKFDYPNWHEIKDLTMIYHENEWDNAEVVVWDPHRQKHMRLVFCGSSRPQGDKPGKINFVVNDIEDYEEQ